ncbi:long-chain-fatty-acid--CoA ligase 1-like isoform X2 [Genypterus blacodes]|uniref:long-chain-fatty-acid--CoA ligase 1-like isoform X2 n=1 Tax=Genypterus blacodes TaxID=154954 RepID=UPI003F77084A
MQALHVLRQLQVPNLDNIWQYVQNFPITALIGMGAFAVRTTYWLGSRPKALKPLCDLNQQSVEIEGGEGVRRPALIHSSKELLTHYYSDALTIYEMFIRGLRVSKDGPCVGWRKANQPYEWQSYKQVVDRAESLGSALLYKGHSNTGDKFIGVFSQNRPEWTISELACHTYSLVVVPLYDTLGTEAISYVIEKASISTVICDVPEKAQLILQSIDSKTRSVKRIAIMEAFDDELVTQGQQSGVEILSLKEFEAFGKDHHQEPVPPKPEDLALVCFTSGTTGNPKGAMLTHGNVISNLAAVLRVLENCKLNDHDIYISYLPLAHMFERVSQGSIFINGGRIGFFQGDIRLLMDDMKTLQPTTFSVVPRLLNRIFDGVYGQANTPLKRWLLDLAYSKKEAELRRGVVRQDSMWDKLIFRKIQASLGGRVRLMITGAAPVSPTVLTFLRVALGCQFYEAYGQTECTAGCTMSMPGDWTAGHVGPPLPCNLMKLVDVAEMNYLAANGEGEVCVKGPNVFQGYLNDPEKTAEAIDKDGWLHTGDIGKWLPNGTLKVIDRKKHMFKLAQGEYIAPEKIENIYIQSAPIAQIFIHGDSLQACLVAIVVPDPDMALGWAKKRGFEGSYSELCSNMNVKYAILQDILRLGKEAGLKSFEQVKDIALHPEMFSIQNGLLTPTLKAKRTELRNYFREQIAALYAKAKV